MIQIDSKYVNDIKYNGNSIGRIILDGDVYWGNDIAPTPTPTPIPSRYTQVSSIRSTQDSMSNGSYIDTGYMVNSNNRVEFKFKLITPRSTNTLYYDWYQFFGVRCKNSSSSWSNNTAYKLYTLEWNTARGYMQTQPLQPEAGSFPNYTMFMPKMLSTNDPGCFYISNYDYYDGKDHIFEGYVDTTSFRLDHTCEGVTNTITFSNFSTNISPDGTSNTSKNFTIFAGKIDSPNNIRGFAPLDCYYFRIYEGDTLVRNYLPVYDTEDNKYGLYDTITQTFLSSANYSKQFILGS